MTTTDLQHDGCPFMAIRRAFGWAVLHVWCFALGWTGDNAMTRYLRDVRDWYWAEFKRHAS